MITSLSLLKVFLNRENYHQYARYLNPKLLEKEIKILLNDFKKYFYSHDNVTDINISEFCKAFQYSYHPEMLEDDLKFYFTVLSQLKDVEPLLVEEVINFFLVLETKQKIQEGWKEEFNPELIKKELDNFETRQVGLGFKSDALRWDEASFEILDRTDGIPWCLKKINDCLRPMISGDFTVIFARVNAGKTAFSISQVATALRQENITAPVLWFNTEGREQDVQVRLLSNLLKRPTPYIQDNWKNIRKDDILINMVERVKIFDSFQKPISYILERVSHYRPCLVIIDQLDHIVHETASKNEVIRLQELYQELRRMSIKYAPILAITQARDNSFFSQKEQKTIQSKYLDLNDARFSRVEKQGAAESVITIGNDDSYPNTRFINIAKSKTGRKNKFECQIKEEFSSYQDF